MVAVAQSVKYLPCQLKDLSWVLRIHGTVLAMVIEAHNYNSREVDTGASQSLLTTLA